MHADLWTLYPLMLRSRLFEEAVTRLWNDGLISGEMHLGTGEEAIAAGVVPHLVDGDAMALDHRGTPPLLMRGVDPVSLLRELLGRPQGLCGGQGGTCTCSPGRTWQPPPASWEPRDRPASGSRSRRSDSGREHWPWRSSARVP